MVKVFEGNTQPSNKPTSTIQFKRKRKDLKMQYPHLFSGNETEENFNDILSQALEFYNYHKYNGKMQGGGAQAQVQTPPQITTSQTPAEAPASAKGPTLITSTTPDPPKTKNTNLKQAQKNNIANAMAAFKGS